MMAVLRSWFLRLGSAVRSRYRRSWGTEAVAQEVSSLPTPPSTSTSSSWPSSPKHRTHRKEISLAESKNDFDNFSNTGIENNGAARVNEHEQSAAHAASQLAAVLEVSGEGGRLLPPRAEKLRRCVPWALFLACLSGDDESLLRAWVFGEFGTHGACCMAIRRYTDLYANGIVKFGSFVLEYEKG